MISASLSLSLPRLGWKSTSTPRSLKICTAAGERASEIRTRGAMGKILSVGVGLRRASAQPAQHVGERLDAAGGRMAGLDRHAVVLEQRQADVASFAEVLDQRRRAALVAVGV